MPASPWPRTLICSVPQCSWPGASAKAEAGQILLSNVVRQLAAGKGFTFIDQGEATLKGFEKPVRLHEVRWQD